MPDGKRCGPSLIAKQEEAERAGFEPAVRFDPHTAFPVPHLRPLGHLSEYTNLFYRFMLRSSLSANRLGYPPLLTFGKVSVRHFANRQLILLEDQLSGKGRPRHLDSTVMPVAPGGSRASGTPAHSRGHRDNTAGRSPERGR